MAAGRGQRGGRTRNSRDFEDVAPVIAAAGRRVLALDVRGRGRSAYDPNPTNYNPAVYAGDVASLMGEAGIARAIFLGTSMGGLITMTLSTLRPDLIAGAILNDIGPEIATEGLTRIGGYVGSGGPAASWTEAAERTRAINGSAQPHLTEADWDRFARRTWREAAPGKLVLDYDPAIAQAFAVAPAGTPSPDLWPLYMALAINRPMLLVRGGASDLLAEGTAARMQALAPQLRRVDIDGRSPTSWPTRPKSLAFDHVAFHGGEFGQQPVLGAERNAGGVHGALQILHQGVELGGGDPKVLVG